MRTHRGTSTGWYPVARAADVGTRPLPVGAGGRAYVLVRLRPGAEVSAFPARCPHRLVPLSAATVVDGSVLKVAPRGSTAYVVFSGDEPIATYPPVDLPYPVLLAHVDLTRREPAPDPKKAPAKGKGRATPRSLGPGSGPRG